MADGQYHNILVPVDGSKVTAQVLEKGIAMAKACDAHLDILNVVQVTQLSDGYAPASSLSPDQTYDLVKIKNAWKTLSKGQSMLALPKSTFTCGLAILSRLSAATFPKTTTTI